MMLRNKKGNVLIITVTAMFIVTSAVIGVLMVTANALHLNSKQREGAAAFNAAESGAEEGALYLKNCSSPPANTSPFVPAITSSLALDEGTYHVTIKPHPNNSTSFLKTYSIVSVGTAGGATRTIEVIVKQASFGRYAYFTDKETSSIGGGAIWWRAGERVDGPAHSNNKDGSNFNINYNNSTGPIFLDTVTGAGSTINYNPSKPKNEATFKKVFKDGSNGYKLGVPPILLPPSSDGQRNAAWGSAAGFPGTNGVFLRSGSNGGLYIRGDAAVQLSLDASGNQVIKVTQGSNVTTVTMNKSMQNTTVTGPVGTGSPTSAGSLGSGVIYCTGNITSLKGEVADNRVIGSDITVRSSLTIANDVNAGKSITITDNLYYHTRPDKTLTSNAPANLAAGTLGLVSKDIKISAAAPRNLEIDAVCLAGGQNTADGSFYVENYNTKSPTGTLKVLGGIIQKARGPVGTFDPGTGNATSGYGKNYLYDPRLAVNPPPYFPTTGQYERLSWQALRNQ